MAFIEYRTRNNEFRRIRSPLYFLIGNSLLDIRKSRFEVHLAKYRERL